MQLHMGVFLSGSLFSMWNHILRISKSTSVCCTSSDATVEIYTHIPGGHELKLFYRHRVDLQRTVVNVPQHAIAVITGKRGSPHNYVRIKYGLTNDEASNNINLIDNYVDLCTRVPSLMNGEVNLLWRGKSKESCLVHFVPKIPSVLHWKTIGVQNAIGIEANQIHVWMWNGSQFQPLMDMTVMEGRTATNVFLYTETMSNEFQVDISITYEFAPPCVQEGTCKDHVDADTSTQEPTCPQHVRQYPDECDERQPVSKCTLECDRNNANSNIKLHVGADEDAKVEIYSPVGNRMQMVYSSRFDEPRKTVVVVPIDVAGITGQCESRQNFAEPSNTPRSKCNCRMKPATSSDKTG